MGAVEDGAAGGRIGLAAVQVVAADLAEEDLAFHAEAAAGLPAARCPASIRRAIILSCGPRDELNLAPLVGVTTWKVPEPGKGVVQNCWDEEGSAVLRMAVFNSVPVLMAWLATPA